MKLLQINASYKPAYVYGGPTISVSTLCEHLSEAGVALDVVTTNANGESNLDVSNGKKVDVNSVNVIYFHRLTKDHSHFTPALYKHLYNELKNYQLVHIHAWWNFVSVGAAFVCKLKRRTFILSPRGTLSNYSFFNRTSLPKRLFHQLVGKWLLKRAIFQVSSKKEEQDILRLFPKAKTHVIPNFIELPKPGETIRLINTSDEFKLIFFSRIEQKKGLEFLLAALEHLDFKYTLDIYGEGEPGYVEEVKKVVPEAAKDKVYFKGPFYGSQKFQLLANYDLMVLPSYEENFANVVIETLSVGTPVLLTANIGLSDYVVAKNFGWLCDQDPVDIRTKIQLIYRDVESRRRIGEEAPKAIERDFSKGALLSKYLRFYEERIQSGSEQ
ncbi:XrtY-associated glycosyltransferase XYAG1 [Aridibaculum aurantiacum]|uniref:XrtY-associated glycosyltransferase XYAG1 n=1 Tax=Aridibaculum aurantiacum TaxID=2810307 RepID=UPI001A976DAB|nr:glycosyltransferase [Aridibaculum aurantiacum]